MDVIFRCLNSQCEEITILDQHSGCWTFSIHSSECRMRDHGGMYYGRLIGSLQEYAHGIKGTAYAVDESTIFVKGFAYDGMGPDAYFWVGSTPRPSPEGYILPYPEEYYDNGKRKYEDNPREREPAGAPQLLDFRWVTSFENCQNILSTFKSHDLCSSILELIYKINDARNASKHKLFVLYNHKEFISYSWSNCVLVKMKKRFSLLTFGLEDPPVLRAYNKTDVILKLPPGRKLRDIKWLSVWCRRFTLSEVRNSGTVNFGEVFIPPNLEPPRMRVLPEFRRLAHGLRSGNITILDAKTFYIPNLHYDGAGPDAYFWVGNGSEPGPYGIKVPNEIRSLEPLRGYLGEDIEIQLPGNLTVYDIDWLAVWCVQYQHNFGHVNIPKDLDVPPALGQTKITVRQNGVCPDERIGGRNDVQLVNGERRNGVTTVTYRRPLHTNEPINDRPVARSGDTSIIAAIGPLNSNYEAYAHAPNDKTNEDVRIDFGSKNDGQCLGSLYNLPDEEELQPWKPEVIKSETMFSVRIGPSGGKRGYSAITGK
ncbi:unnamed protein product [Nesidiocoris tenuis]|uniref:DM13 domain-containing protein n=1 Tax=Nesidiocoris tenuis TaxID=355587 RepID=A0A6H5GYX5_9HEMI|nr:unnamed protein product [Nesidiocoris tenuis]